MTDALSDARKSAARALRLKPPAYRGGGAQGDALAFLNGPLVRWVKGRRALEADALDAYRLAADPKRPEVTARAAMEAAELALDFSRSFISAALSAMPRSIRADPEQTRAFRSALQDAAAPELERARKFLRQCVAAARSARLDALRQQCAARLVRLPSVPSRASNLGH